MRKNEKAITLIALVITIIVLLILAGVTILTLTGENGILTKTNRAKEETNKEEATEILKLKMADCQMESIGEKGEYPTLAYLAAFLNRDEEIDYVDKQSKPIAALDETPYQDWDKIYTKLEQYPYEFEIDGNFRVAVNGEQVGIPAGYMKIPTESLTINENNKNYDVTNYANVNVNIPEPKNCDKKTVQFPSTGSTCEFDFGYVPSFFFLEARVNSGVVVWHWSCDSMQTMFVCTNQRVPFKAVPHPLDGTKMIIDAGASASDWNGITFNVYAIK